MKKPNIFLQEKLTDKVRFDNGRQPKTIKRTVYVFLFLLIVGFAMFNQSVNAQDNVNAGFTGEVYGSDGKPLPNVTVTFTNIDTGIPSSTRTSNDGRFVKNALLPGKYRVEISVDGYQPEKREQILVSTKTNQALPPFHLKKTEPVAVTTQPTPVTSPTPLATVTAELTTDTNSGELVLETRRGGAFTEKEITGFPLGSLSLVRSFDDLAFLVPGVVPAPQAIGNSVGPGVGPGVGTSGQFSVNGLRSRANNFTVDGSDNNDEDIGVRRQGFFSLIPQPVESIQEFQIITLLAPAQYGRNLGAQVNVLSKSGGNRFNGTLYAFFNSDRLNAPNEFDFVGANTRLPLQGRRRNGTFANVLIGPSQNTATQTFVENNSGDKDALTFLQAGGAFGGRIVRSKMFFFVSAEGQWLNASKESNFAVPTVEQRGFLGLGAEGISIPGNEAFPTTIIGDFVIGLFPFPNNPTGLFGRNTYTRELSADARGRVFSGKYDYNFDIGGKRQALTARYNYTDDRRDLQQVGGAVFSSIRPITRTDNFSVFLNGELTDNLSNVLRLSWGRTRLRFEELPYAEGYMRPVTRNFTNPEDARFLLSGLGLVNSTNVNLTGEPNVLYLSSGFTIEQFLGPVGQVNIAGFSPLGVDVFNFPQKRINNTFQIADTMFLRSGKHNFAFGTDIRRTILDSDLPRNSRMSITSTGAFRANNYTGPIAVPALISPLDILTTGFVTGVFQSLVLPNRDAEISLSFNQLNFFIQDDFRANKNFTLTYGLRYELNTVPKEADRKIEDSFQETLPTQLSGLAQFIDGRSRIYDSDTNNFAPRIGFAYAPNRSTVIRGGYGLYYDQILGAVVSQSRNVFPTFSTLNFGGVPTVIGGNFTIPTSYNQSIGIQPIIQNGTLNTLNVTQQQLINFLATAGYPTPFGATIPDRELEMPLSHQYSIGVEQKLFSNTVLSIAYVGTAGRNLLRFTTPNAGRNNIVSIQSLSLTGLEPRFTGVNRAPTRSVANIGPIDQFETTGRSRYDSLQFQLRGRLERSFQYQISYTFAKAQDDVSDVFDLAGAYALPQNSATFAGEYAPANFDVRHRFTYSFIYDLPKFDNRGAFYKFLLGGWQIIGTGKFNTGQPFTVNTIFDVNQDGNPTDRLNNTQSIVETGSRRQPLMLTSQANLIGMLAPIGQDGSVPRNSFRAGNLLELDMSFNKRFSITERQFVLFRLDIFNFINRANFGIPVRFLEAPSFGQAVDTVTPGRRIQIALKYSF